MRGEIRRAASSQNQAQQRRQQIRFKLCNSAAFSSNNGISAAKLAQQRRQAYQLQLLAQREFIRRKLRRTADPSQTHATTVSAAALCETCAVQQTPPSSGALSYRTRAKSALSARTQRPVNISF